jgi:cytochrome P450
VPLSANPTKDEALGHSTLVFDPFSAEFYSGPFPIYRRMRDEAPVYYSEQYDVYALSRHEDVATGFKDFDTYSSAHDSNVPVRVRR